MGFAEVEVSWLSRECEGVESAGEESLEGEEVGGGSEGMVVVCWVVRVEGEV